MITRSVTETREGFADLLGQVQYGGEQVAITKRGKVVAAIVSADDLAALEAMEDRWLARMGDEAYEEYLRDPSKVKTAEAVFARLLGDDPVE